MAPAKPTIPAIALAGRVTDAAHILTPGQAASLSIQSERLEQATGHQLVVVTVPMLRGTDIALFTSKLANAWGVGRQGYDDGVVLLVAPRERQVRIAVGYGLESSLTTKRCQRIIDKQMTPLFRKGDLPGGIAAGAAAIIAQLRQAR